MKSRKTYHRWLWEHVSTSGCHIPPWGELKKQQWPIMIISTRMRKKIFRTRWTRQNKTKNQINKEKPTASHWGTKHITNTSLLWKSISTSRYDNQKDLIQTPERYQTKRLSMKLWISPPRRKFSFTPMHVLKCWMGGSTISPSQRILAFPLAHISKFQTEK